MDILQLEIVSDFADRQMPVFNSSYIRTETYPLSEVFSRIETGDIRLVTIDGRRKSKWKKEQRELFVTSVLNGLPVPLIYMNAEKEGATVIDGFERLTALYEFCRGNVDYTLRMFGNQLSGQEEFTASVRRKLLSVPVQLCFLAQKTPVLLRYRVFQWLAFSGHYSLNQAYVRLMKQAQYQWMEKLDELQVPAGPLDAELLAQAVSYMHFRKQPDGCTEQDSTCLAYDILFKTGKDLVSKALELLYESVVKRVAQLFPRRRRSWRLVLAFYLLSAGNLSGKELKDKEKMLSDFLHDDTFARLSNNIFDIERYIQSHSHYDSLSDPA